MNKQRMLEAFREEFKSMTKKKKFFKLIKKIKEEGFEVFSKARKLTVDSFSSVEDKELDVCWFYKDDPTYMDFKYPIHMLWHLLDVREPYRY